jgi:hypothetical protein
MGRRTREKGGDLFPGGTGALSNEGFQLRPVGGKRLVDHATAGVEEPQRIRLGLVGQAEIIAQGLSAAWTHYAAPEEQMFASCPYDTISALSTARI